MNRVLLVAMFAAGSVFASCASQPISKTTAVTKPMSPADGAKDYENGTSPHGPPVVPSGSDKGEQTPGKPACPPQCTPAGAWVGCGLPKPRNSNCTGCTPKCKSKGTPDEGWYDCSGVLIVAHACD